MLRARGVHRVRSVREGHDSDLHTRWDLVQEASGTGLSGADLADRLLHEAGVCVLPGTAFGGLGGDHVRISYANSQANLLEALGRIRVFVEPLVAARV